MTFNHAITNKYITDYRVWFPMIHEDLSQLRNDISTEINVRGPLVLMKLAEKCKNIEVFCQISTLFSISDNIGFIDEK
jgi:hypothetical protein